MRKPNPAASKFSIIEDKNYVNGHIDDPINIQYNIKESAADCLKVCEADPKCNGFTWFKANAGVLAKTCVGFPGEPYSRTISNQHSSATRLPS